MVTPLCGMQDMQDRLAVDMAQEAQAIPASVHVLTIHGSEDATIPVESAHKYAQLIATHDLHIVEGADHCFRGHAAQQEMISTATKFICQA